MRHGRDIGERAYGAHSELAVERRPAQLRLEGVVVVERRAQGGVVEARIEAGLVRQVAAPQRCLLPVGLHRCWRGSQAIVVQRAGLLRRRLHHQAELLDHAACRLLTGNMCQHAERTADSSVVALAPLLLANGRGSAALSCSCKARQFGPALRQSAAKESPCVGTFGSARRSACASSAKAVVMQNRPLARSTSKARLASSGVHCTMMRPCWPLTLQFAQQEAVRGRRWRVDLRGNVHQAGH